MQPYLRGRSEARSFLHLVAHHVDPRIENYPGGGVTGDWRLEDIHGTHSIYPWDWYCIFTYIIVYTIKKQPNVGKYYTSPMDGMGR